MTSPLSVVYPPGCLNRSDRRQHLARLREALRRHHNAMGDLYESGRIAETEWRGFLRTSYKTRREALSIAEGRLRAAQKKELMQLQDGARELEMDLDAAFQSREVPR
jgi:hypothetical protein